MAVLLPYLVNLKISGFSKMFENREVEIPLNPGFAIILGGNGLGKTTLLQALIYAVAGPLDDEEIEPEKSRRWTISFFKGRLTSADLTAAIVEATFRLGESELMVQRGFTRSSVTKLLVKSPSGSTVYEGATAQRSYEQSVCSLGNYSSYNDFRFLVHRLLYLAEDRRGITWDLDAQARILMLLNSDLLKEAEFRDGRDRLVKLDSAKRHTRVRINHLEKQWQKSTGGTPTPTPTKRETTTSPGRSLDSISDDIRQAVTARQRLDERQRELESQEAALRQSIYDLTERQRRSETVVISSSIAAAASAQGMYLQKLLNHGTCPSCGCESHDLQRLAKERVARGACPICGVGETQTPVNHDIEAILSQMNEKAQAREEVGLRLLDVRHDLRRIVEEESRLRAEYELARFSLASGEIPMTRSIHHESLTPEQIQAELEKLYPQEKDLIDSIDQTRTMLESTYNQYIAAANDRLERLGEIFSALATEFLGTETTLRKVMYEDKLIQLSLFVPVFDGEEREQAEDCSEAQRFFLDIALRMAILNLAQELGGHENSFVCETPESALDVSYVDNAAKMFRKFVQSRHGMVATTNLQRFGLAHQILLQAKTEGIHVNVFDLLQYGRLSKVQKESDALRTIRDEILEAVK